MHAVLAISLQEAALGSERELQVLPGVITAGHDETKKKLGHLWMTSVIGQLLSTAPAAVWLECMTFLGHVVRLGTVKHAKSTKLSAAFCCVLLQLGFL